MRRGVVYVAAPHWIYRTYFPLKMMSDKTALGGWWDTAAHVVCMSVNAAALISWACKSAAFGST